MRLIDADALKPDYIVGSTSTNTECYRYVSLEQIVNTPTADARANVKGKWIRNNDSDHAWKCSVCGCGYTDFRLNYCYDCGARMEKEKE